MSMLNCIVDDSALVASVKPNAVHSVVPWINQGTINVYVPLYALERLARLSRIQCSVSADASKALRWLDQVTSWTEHKIAGRVKLQGPEDQYQSWEDVEKYLLPDTPLTANHGPQRMDRLSKMLDRNICLNGQAQGSSPHTSPTSTASSLSSTVHVEDETSSTLSAHGIATQIRPLLNYTVWCTQQVAGHGKSNEKFVLVTNDHVIQKQASKFGVRAKVLNQLQTVLGRAAPLLDSIEMVSLKPSDGWSDPFAAHHDGDGDDDGEDEVVFNPSQRPKSSRGSGPAANLIDPNHFGRDPQPQGATSVQSPRRGNGRGARNALRGKTSNHRGRGGRSSGASTGTSPSAPNTQRGGGRGRASDTTLPRAGAVSAPRQIDPDSFARPAHMTRRGRGNVHKLWEPTSSG